MFITNDDNSFHLWSKKNLVKHKEVSKYYDQDCRSLESTETSTNLSKSNSSTLLFKLFKSLGTFFNLSNFNLSTSDFKLGKLVFLAKDDASTPVAFFKSAFVA